MSDYDVVVIGSGAGGLTAAVALARAGKSVLVVEQHYLPGGWCHSFTLEGYKFSPGVHYIGQLQPGGMMRNVYEGLGVANDLTMLELNPDGFDHVRIGEERFDYCSGKDQQIARLIERFPADAAGIRRYYEILSAVNDEIAGGPPPVNTMLDKLKVPLRYVNTARYAWRSVDSILDQCGLTDPLLRGVLTIQGGDHGMPSSRCPLGIHATVIGHYFDGGWYPKGGGMAIPRAFIKELRRNGGILRMKTEVSEILVRDGRAHGVKLADGTTVTADVVISNADPGITWGRLVPEDQVPFLTRQRLKRTRYSMSALSLFFAVDMDVKAAGLDSGNYWYATSPENVGSLYDARHTRDLSQIGALPGIFLTCTTLKNPMARRDGIHTLEAFSLMSNEAFSQWAGTRMGNRGPAYDAVKEDFTERILDRVNELLPGVRDHLRFSELGTPLTNRYYCNATGGNLYGIEKNRFQMGPLGFPLVSSIQGLYQCGASTIGHGVAGATFSGLLCAQQVLGCRVSEMLTAKQQEITLLPADDPDVWPPSYRSSVATTDAPAEGAVGAA